MIDTPSLAKFSAFVQLKDFRAPTKKEYVRYVRRLGDHYQCDHATLTEDQVRAYYLELRQVRKFGASAMKVAKCALRASFQDCLHITGWTVFGELRIGPRECSPRIRTNFPTNLHKTKPKTFSAFETGSLADWVNHSVELPGLGKIPGKLFLKEHRGLTG